MNKAVILFAVVLLTGCAVGSDRKEAPDARQSVEDHYLASKAQQTVERAARIQGTHKVIVVDSAFYGPETEVVSEKHAWLRDINLPDAEFKEGAKISVESLLKALAGQGVHIAANLDISGYYYQGYAPDHLDAFSALEILTPRMTNGERTGLDFVVNDERKLVTLVPFTFETYRIKVFAGKTKASFGENDFVGGVGDGVLISSASSTRVRVDLDLDFVRDLNAELTAICAMALLPMREGEEGSGACQHHFNDRTGTIRVYGSRQVHTEISSYIARLHDDLNTTVVIEGRIIEHIVSRDQQEGINANAFFDVNREGGFYLNNSLLGNIAADPFNGATAPLGALAQTTIGYAEQGGQAASAFLSYLNRFGEAKKVDEFSYDVPFGHVIEDAQPMTTAYARYKSESNSSTTQTTSTVDTEIVEIEAGDIYSIYIDHDSENDTIHGFVNIQTKQIADFLPIIQFFNGVSRTEQIITEIPLFAGRSYVGGFVLKPGQSTIIKGNVNSRIISTDGGIKNTENWPDYAKALLRNETETLEQRHYYIVFTAYTKSHI